MSEPSHPNYRLQDLQRRWERDPSSRVYHQLAEEYQKAGQLVEAAVVLEDGLGRRPNDIAGRVALGRCRLELGQVEEATEALENVIARDPAHHVANKLLLDAYLQAGALVQARERLEIYRLINDRDPELEHLGFRLQQLESGGSLPSEEAAAEEPTAEGEGPEDEASEEVTWTPETRETMEVEAVTPDELVTQETPIQEASTAETPAGDAVEGRSFEAEVAESEAAMAPLPPFEASPLEASASEVFAIEDTGGDVVTNDSQEALNMPSRSSHPEANDVFNFGVVSPPVDSFAALWADLETALPSSTNDDVLAVEPSAEIAEDPAEAAPVVEAVEDVVKEASSEAIPAREAHGELPAEPFAIPPADAASEPFGQLTPPGGDDVWQSLASQAPVAEMPAETPAEETSAEEAPAEETLAEATPDETTPDETPADEAEEPQAAFELEDAPTEPLRPAAVPSSKDRTAALAAAALGAVGVGAAALGMSTDEEPEAAQSLEGQTREIEVPETPSSTAAVVDEAVDEPEVSAAAVEVEPEAIEVEAVEVEPEAIEVEAVEVEPEAIEVPAAASEVVEDPAAEIQADETPLMETPTVETSSPDEAEDDAVPESEEAEPTVTLGSLYLKQGHREEAARIFEGILRKEPGNQAALAGLNLARKADRAGLTAIDLIADQSLTGTIPAGMKAKKILVLSNYLQHLKARGKENHVH